MTKATITLAIAIAAALTLGSCTTSQPALYKRRAETSWAAFCTARGYNPQADHADEYLDTWRGSAEEEAALSEAGLQTF